MRNRRAKMTNANALCPHCKSADVRYIDDDHYDRMDRLRPLFACGSCGEWWTAGRTGKPYIDFAREDFRFTSLSVRQKMHRDRWPKCPKCGGGLRTMNSRLKRGKSWYCGVHGSFWPGEVKDKGYEHLVARRPGRKGAHSRRIPFCVRWGP